MHTNPIERVICVTKIKQYGCMNLQVNRNEENRYFAFFENDTDEVLRNSYNVINQMSEFD